MIPWAAIRHIFTNQILISNLKPHTNYNYLNIIRIFNRCDENISASCGGWLVISADILATFNITPGRNSGITQNSILKVKGDA